MNKNILLELSLISLLIGCQNQPTQPSSTVDKNDKTIITNPLAANYSGTLPCADCNGIHTILQLHPDNHYNLTLDFLNRNQPPKKITGLYRSAINRPFIQLDDRAENLTFFIGNHYLEVRAPDGSRWERPLSDEHYRLQQQ